MPRHGEQELFDFPPVDAARAGHPESEHRHGKRVKENPDVLHGRVAKRRIVNERYDAHEEENREEKDDNEQHHNGPHHEHETICHSHEQDPQLPKDHDVSHELQDTEGADHLEQAIDTEESQIDARRRQNQFNERAHDQESVNEIPGKILAGEEGATTSKNPEQQLDSEDHHEASLDGSVPVCQVDVTHVTVIIRSQRLAQLNIDHEACKDTVDNDDNSHREREWPAAYDLSHPVVLSTRALRHQMRGASLCDLQGTLRHSLKERVNHPVLSDDTGKLRPHIISGRFGIPPTKDSRRHT
mmetsp:Transcript_65262/g.173029  ORF Transcript_65262/g.173029 Transcript_65262/m.173029 type:complete len:299 (+) Transcript_65262:791-1687(+)